MRVDENRTAPRQAAPMWKKSSRARKPKTCWVGGPPSIELRPEMAEEPDSSVDPQTTARVLSRLIQLGLSRGHYKVAMRRYFMVLALGLPVGASITCTCEAMMAAIAEKELRRMLADAQAWAKMARSEVAR